MTGKIIIYEVLDELGKEKSMESLEKFLSRVDPARIFISLEDHSQDIHDFLFSKYGNIPIAISSLGSILLSTFVFCFILLSISISPTFV